MGDHKIEPARRGRHLVCKACGYLIVSYRATRLIRKRHWRHMTAQQAYIGERARRNAEFGL